MRGGKFSAFYFCRRLSKQLRNFYNTLQWFIDIAYNHDSDSNSCGKYPVMRQLSNNITQILQKWSEGDESSLDTLVTLVYQELHRLAHRALARSSGHNTIQTTALVHEAYLRLANVKEIDWQDRIHFFAVSANLMRNILVDFARNRTSQKRGGGLARVDFDEALNFSPDESENLIVLDEALTELAKLNERQSRIVELKFFGGLTEEEIAEVLKISPATVSRDWKFARVWLYRQVVK